MVPESPLLQGTLGRQSTLLVLVPGSDPDYFSLQYGRDVRIFSGNSSLIETLSGGHQTHDQVHPYCVWELRAHLSDPLPKRLTRLSSTLHPPRSSMAASDPLRQVIVDNTDPSIRYNGADWFPTDVRTLNNGHFGPVFNATSHATTSSNTEFSFTFNGTSIMVQGNIDMTIDPNTNATVKRCTRVRP
ncbi:hypothetical protein FB45DRAFT_1054441 [Roridomyces roridus]|uniref:Uncharacterized protein n=1 Tax=Roridomyces roridus TaxID=1738132 RepID=A0AAD7FTQ7_9AGAR|nr:hypothetical protein FB45DRAFT_1054441 [Roridomyces roridus]